MSPFFIANARSKSVYYVVSSLVFTAILSITALYDYIALCGFKKLYGIVRYDVLSLTFLIPHARYLYLIPP